MALSLAMKYALKENNIYSEAHDLAMLTVNGNSRFLDHSPDTRITTFKAAVAAEKERVLFLPNFLK